MRTLLFILLLLPTLDGHSQQSVIDSLTNRLQQGINDSDRTRVLYLLAGQLKHGNPDTAITLYTEALSIAEKIDSKVDIANINNGMGSFYMRKGAYQKALSFYFVSLELFDTLDLVEGIAGNLGDIGIIYKRQGDYAKALQYYFKALKLNEEHANKKLTGINLGNIGNIYLNQDDYPQALDYYFKALKLARELDRKGSIAYNLGNIGTTYHELGDYPKSLEYYFKALNQDEELDNKSGLVRHLGNIGAVYANHGDPSNAMMYYIKAMALAEELGDKKSIVIGLINLGSLYIDTKEYIKAESTLEKGIIVSQEIGAKEYLKNLHEIISGLYHTTGRPTQAFEAYKLYIIYRDSISNEENTKAQTRTEMKYEYEKADLLKKQEETETARLEAEATTRRDNLQYSVVLICLLVIGLLVAMLGRMSLPAKAAEGLIFFSFLIFFEFLLVLADPYIEGWSGGAPGIKLLFNAGIAALIFPMHSLFETKMKSRLSR